MEFKIKRDELAKILSNITKIIPPKSAYTILQNIIIEAFDGRIEIQATDLDIFIKRTINADVKEKGKVLIPGKKILEITREASTEFMNFKLKELKLEIRAGKAHFNIPSLDYQEFPEVPDFPKTKWFDFNLGDFEDMIATTTFMVARDMSRRPMNGLLVQVKKNQLRIVATDGARLALHNHEQKASAGELIVATKVFDLIDFDNPEEKLEVFSEERIMGLKYLDTMIIARLIEGPYPNYEGVIPAEFSGTCAIERELLEGALKRVSLVAQPHLKNVKFEFSGKNIALSASSPDFGEANEDVPCVYEGNAVEIWFNAGFILELFRHLKTMDVIFQLTSQSSAAIVRPKGNESLMYLLMPLRMDSWE
jgi:DNA polymerase-3 subunit beta